MNNDNRTLGILIVLTAISFGIISLGVSALSTALQGCNSSQRPPHALDQKATAIDQKATNEALNKLIRPQLEREFEDRKPEFIAQSQESKRAVGVAIVIDVMGAGLQVGQPAALLVADRLQAYDQWLRKIGPAMRQKLTDEGTLARYPPELLKLYDFPDGIFTHSEAK